MINRSLSATNFFLRTYFVVVTIIIGAAWLLDNFLARQLSENINQQDALKLTGSFYYAESQLTAVNNKDEVSAETLAKLSNTITLPVNILNLEDLSYSESIRQQLADDMIVTLFNNHGEKLFYKKMLNQPLVLALGPLQESTPNQSENWVIPLFYFTVALAIFFFTWPLIKSLNTLSVAAQKLGSNDFSARVDIAQNSSIFPVAATFNQMAERIQYLMSSQKELRNAISHELRTPLARLKFSLEIILGKAQSATDAEYIRSMKTDIDEIDALIEELLNYAKVENDITRLNIESLDMPEWLRQQLPLLHRHAPNLALELTVVEGSAEAMKFVDFEQHLLARALSNLIRNAERYGNGKALLVLAITPNECSIQVNDNGPGIPPQDREKIFTEFTRLETSRAKNSGGYGLGLAIVKRIMERHQGHISVTDSTLGGACFTLRWPRRVADLAPNLPQSR